jgi:hypothetical protein
MTECVQISFDKVSDVGLQRYLEKFDLCSTGLDRAGLLATVQSHFDTWHFAPSPPGGASAPEKPPTEAEIIEHFFRKVFSGRGARRTRRGRRKRCLQSYAEAADAEKMPAADWDALPTEHYGKGRRQRRVKVRTDV